MARIKDVAAAAGVSVAAVSRHLNGRLVLPAPTVARIEGAIRSLGYRPNPHARRLSLGRSDLIGLVLPDIANPFFARLAAAVEEAADELGWQVVLFATMNRPEREFAYLERMRHHHVDGLIFVTNHGDPDGGDGGQLARAIGAAPGVVLVDEDVRGTGGAKVFCDNDHGGWLAGTHLVASGHRDLALIGGPPDLMSGHERARGFRRAIREARPPARILAELPGPYSIAHGREAARAVLAMRPRPTAIFAASDETAQGVLSALRAAGIGVPEEMSIVGFDDVGPLDLFDPPLTTIRQPVREMGRHAVRLLGEAPAAPSALRLPVELVSRRSVAPPCLAKSANNRRRLA